MSTIRVSSVTRISTAADGTQANNNSFGNAFSSDGTKVAFSSTATNLVAGDANLASDIFVKDLRSGAVSLVSTASNGTQMTDSFLPLFSRDGNAVAFVSGSFFDLGYLKDLRTGQLWQLTQNFNGNVTGMDFSPDGTSLLVMYTGNPAQTTALILANLGTRQLGFIDIIGANSISEGIHFSPDGHHIAYARFPSGIYLADLAALVPPAPWDYGNATIESTLIDPKGNDPAFSPDGKKLAFDSTASDLVAGDTNGVRDIFVKDLTTGAITRISTAGDGTQANGDSKTPLFSPDGSLVVFASNASNLVPGDTNGKQDIFVKDLTTGSITRISVTALGEEANGGAGSPHFSPDGSKILYSSDASNLVGGDTNQYADVFVAAIQSRGLPLGLAGDFNADGKADVLWRNDNGAVDLWRSNPGSVNFADQDLAVYSSAWHIEQAADFNGDGKADVLWRNDNGDVDLWRSNPGLVTFTDQNLGVYSSAWHIEQVADFNGDGKADVLWRNDNGAVDLWRSNPGSVTFADQDLGVYSSAWHIEQAADFNGDGKADVLWRNDNGAVDLWRSNPGSVTFTDQDLGVFSSAWHIEQAADFNGDGKADVLWRNDNGAVDLWRSNPGSVTFADQDLGVYSSAWHIEQAGDFNGDGKADVLWRNDNGDVDLWMSNPGAVTFTDQDLGVYSSNWHIT